MAKTSPKLVARRKRSKRIRIRSIGTPERPRMRVYRSNRHIYVQIIDDSRHATLVSMSTKDKAFDGADLKGKTAQAKKVGELIAQRAKEVGITRVIFDRGGNLYHGRVKALTDGAREAGLDF
ncbi:MAG: 50S ribosomal protein L18 [Candidatus Marinimicrobia bacterium]|nr:50S ribosomal protein L18 [Candidatus Neomarinimicrobiota bacterium]